MAPITQSKPPINEPFFDLDVGTWLRSHVFDNLWKSAGAIALVLLNIAILRLGYLSDAIELSPTLAPDGIPTPTGELILGLTNGIFLTNLVLGLWLLGALAVIYCAGRRSWPRFVRWLQESLYSGFFGALITLGLSLSIVLLLRALFAWGLFGAIFTADPDTVSTLQDATPGAVWGAVFANLKLFATGQYPMGEIHRVWASLGVVGTLMVLSVLAWNFGSPLKRFRQAIVWGWLSSIFIILLILHGRIEFDYDNVESVGDWWRYIFVPLDFVPLETVGTNLWGGLLLTMILSIVGIVFSFPLGLILALGRRGDGRGVPMLWVWGVVVVAIYWLLGGYPGSEPTTLRIPLIFLDPPLLDIPLPAYGYAALQAVGIVGLFWVVDYTLKGNLIKAISITYIEVVRGVPLITVLFMAQIMLPIFLPRDFDIDNLLRVQIAIILFSAAYLAENVRGGLQSIPKGQYEAAMAVGLNQAQSMRLIILPQALRAVIPAIVGQFIALFKDTSLVAIVGLFDLLKIATLVVAQPDWLGLQRETFTFVAFVYWVFAFLMSRASQQLERNLGVGKY